MTRKKRGFALKKLCYIADNDVMQRLYKNENLLFRDFQEFLSRKQHIPENRLPYYLRWISRFHEFCSRRNIDGNGQDSIAAYLLDLAKDHEDWQVQQAKEAVRLFRYFKAMQDATPTEGGIDGTASWQLVEDEVIRALRLRHRSYRTEQLSALAQAVRVIHRLQGAPDGYPERPGTLGETDDHPFDRKSSIPCLSQAV